MAITITEKAANEVKRIIKEQQTEGNAPEQIYLRMRVVGGGCHGFSYALGFDDRKDGDTVQRIDGVDFLVDKFSAPYLMGANVDFVDGLNGAGFKIGNPNAKSTCGCGTSFST